MVLLSDLQVMKIYRTKDIRTVDRLYMEKTGVSQTQLIERAALAFVRAFIREEKKPARALVVAGPGNNGADARSVARLLTEQGWQTDLWDFSDKDSLERQQADWASYLENLSTGVVVVDGLFGSGLTRPVTGFYSQIIEGINFLDTRVYAVDIPSGLPGDGIPFTGGAVVKASATFTFQFPKLSFFFAENYPYVGRWEVLDIGMGGMVYPEVETPFRMTEESDIHNLFPRKRHPFSFKNNYGHALLIAGSLGKMGAAILAARSCLRMGTGLLTAHLPGRGEIPMQTSLPEALVSLDSHRDVTGDLPQGLLIPKSPFTAIGAGPGLGKSRETTDLLRNLLTWCGNKTPCPPLVLDADALNIISEHPDMMEHLPVRTVLTPHPGEFDRLARACGLERAENSYLRAMQAIEMAVEHKVIIVLKGRYTLIATPGSPHWFNPTGNPAMATAGSGDVLTGIILGLLAQGYDPRTAAVLGVWLHAGAGDRAAAGGKFILAGDIIENL